MKKRRNKLTRRARMLISAKALAGRDVSLSCAVRLSAAATGENPGPPKFTMVAYTGQPMRVGMELPVVVDLQGLNAGSKSRPILKDHRTSLHVGHTTAIENDGRSLRATGVISSTSAVAKEVVESGRNGFPWQASITASIQRLERIAKGRSVDVNGRNIPGPVFVARASTLKEISFVALGADDDTTAAIAAQRKEKANMKFKAWLKKKGIDITTLSASVISTLKAAWKSEMKLQAAAAGGGNDNAGDAGGDSEDDESDDIEAGDEDADDEDSEDDESDDVEAGDEDADDEDAEDGDDEEVEASDEGSAEPRRRRAPVISASDVREQISAERMRVASIEGIRGIDRFPKIRAKALARGWSREKTELRVLRAMQDERPDVHARSDSRAMANNARVIECALCLSAGLSQDWAEDNYSERVLEAATSQRYRGMGLQELLHSTIRAAGKTPRRLGVDNDTIRAAFEADRELRASVGGFSTIGITGILGNVANKIMLDAWNSIDAVWEMVSAPRNVPDFKLYTSYRLDLSGGFTKVGQDGELKHISLKESSFTNQADTYGSMLAITRQQLINDDMGAFQQVAAMIGRLGRLRLGEVFWTLWLSNPSSFWGTGNSNYFSGSDSVLSHNSMDTAVKTFRKMVDSNSKPIMVSPDRMLVPPELEGTANRLFSSELLLEAATAGTPTGNANVHKGKYKVLVSPHLSNSAFTGYSTTAWWLLGNPATAASAEIAYLRGQQTPVVEQGELDFDKLGIGWRSYLDFGVGMRDTQASVKSKGAA